MSNQFEWVSSHIDYIRVDGVCVGIVGPLPNDLDQASPRCFAIFGDVTNPKARFVAQTRSDARCWLKAQVFTELVEVREAARNG